MKQEKLSGRLDYREERRDTSSPLYGGLFFIGVF